MNSSTGAPTLIQATPTMTLHYSTQLFWGILETWYTYRLTGRAPSPTWEDDSAISHRVTPNQAAWCAAVEEYADFDQALSGIANASERQAVGLYWRDGLRSVRQVALAMHTHMDTARVLVWSGTERLIVRLCGLSPQDAGIAARLYRERLPMKRIER